MTDEQSLLPALFSVPSLPIELLLYYLYKHDSSGVQAFLINKLYEIPIEKVFEFLPQLINISTQKQEHAPYSSFFLDTSVKSHVFAVKLYWMLQANLYDGPRRYSPLLRSTLRDLEKVIVNGQKSRKGQTTQPPHLFKLNISESEKDLLIHKQARADYFNDQHKLAQTLGRISIELISVPDEEKDTALAEQIQELDNWVRNTREYYNRPEHSNYIKRLYRGIVLPLEFYAEETYSEQIVSIPSSECKCFKTKARVPYKIIVETIDINEEELENEAEIRNPLKCNKINGESIKTAEINEIKSISTAESEDALAASRTDEIEIENSNSQIKTSLDSPWGEAWEDTKSRIQASSIFGHYKSWKLRPLIVKGHDDLRQELLAMQVIKKCNEIFQAAKLRLYLRPYNILIISHNSGFIECIPDAVSLHAIKKTYPNYTNLSDFFSLNFRSHFLEAQKNFIESLAGYSLISYILNLKDRHNGNILLDSKGHIIHIDFGFFLTNTPGGNINFESAPFKLTNEMVDLMGGYQGELFIYYKILLYQGFLALRKHTTELLLIIEMMRPGESLNCFRDSERALKEFSARFRLDLSEEQCMEFIEKLVEKAADNWKTVKYDSFQRLANGIL
ncbi:unnamed protein product [Blepharisma stoltei]|uniref:1-phosphatidylinositol 4-kinase n=1 Tax=Blepharisma stoltei TaxID=1481888 RepID=A0AAU9JN91_9CILI|nr:unnamed protein product [Blepharisma stoltei]